MMVDLKQFEVWFVTGSQHLYGPETLAAVAEHSKEIAQELSHSSAIPVNVVFKPVLTTAEDIRELCLQANVTKNCVGLILWMHTFSPAKMWIAGLSSLQKPFVHLHTQYNRDLPWSSIDMDFMNLNQSAHGDREFGFIGSRLRVPRKVVVGYWRDEDVQSRLGEWARVASAWADAQGARVARFGDNMRDVAVTDGDKVEAQIRLGYSVSGYGVGDLVDVVNQVTDSEITQLVKEYSELYEVAPELRSGGSRHQALREEARIELGLRHFLEAGNFKAFTTTFEDLHGLAHLPGLSVQRLMADGYGFGPEGDWKTAALLRTMKVMGTGLEGGASLMEDYTYNLSSTNMLELGSHMLEVCPSISREKPKLEIHPLSIGGKADPLRLVFDTKAGPAVAASLIDLGNRHRLIVNAVDVVDDYEPLPKLPVARAVWKPQPDLKTAATAWILAGGAHHTSFSQALTAEYLEDYAEIAGIEFLLIDNKTDLFSFKKELRLNEAYYLLSRGLR